METSSKTVPVKFELGFHFFLNNINAAVFLLLWNVYSIDLQLSCSFACKTLPYMHSNHSRLSRRPASICMFKSFLQNMKNRGVMPNRDKSKRNLYTFQKIAAVHGNFLIFSYAPTRFCFKDKLKSQIINFDMHHKIIHCADKMVKGTNWKWWEKSQHDPKWRKAFKFWIKR